MKIRNLLDYPMQIGDRKMIGAAGTSEAEREYLLDKLTKDDQQLVKREMLEVIKEDVPAPPEASETDKPKGGQTNAK